MITNYTELKDEVKAFSHRTDLADRMDTICQLAEALINKDLRVLENEKRQEVMFDSAFYDFPSDYMELRALHLDINGRRTLEMMSPQQLDKLYSNASGNPRGAAIHGGQLEIRPAPSAASTFDGEITYYARVPSLVSNSTNDVLTAYPMVYFAAMMVQVNVLAQDSEQLQIWNSALNEQMTQANKSAGKGRWNQPRVRAF